jgi:hypothetical protein
MLKETDVIFRWIGGRVVPIRIKAGSDPEDITDPKERFDALLEIQRKAEGWFPAFKTAQGAIIRARDGEATHTALLDRMNAEKKAGDAFYHVFNMSDGFVDKEGKFLTRDEADKVFGTRRAERLAILKRASAQGQ